MHILYLCADRGIPVRGHKGAAVHVRALTDALVQAGHTVTILTPRPGPEEGPAPRAEVVAVPSADAGALTAAALDWLAANPCQLLYERYSLWSDAGARLAAAAGLPLVLEVNAPLRAEAARHRSLEDDALAGQIEATQFAAADHLAVVSQSLADYVVQRGADPGRVHITPNGVDPQHFHPAVRGGSVRHRWGLHGRIVVGFAGRMRPWHDGPTLLRAFARLHAADRAYHLLLVGEMDPALLEAVARDGLAGAVTCTGAVPHSEAPAHLAAMDVAVSPHAAPEVGEDFYFSPLKLFEYLACGVPTVAAAVGQPARLIQPGVNGALYPPGDDAALAAAISRLVQEPAHARALAWQGAVDVLTRHTWAGNARQVVDWVRPAGKDQEAPTPATAGGAPDLPIFDAKLRQRLYRATRPDLAAPLLAEVLVEAGAMDRRDLLHVDAIEVLKYKPQRRCVLAYHLHGQSGLSAAPRQVIGKVFRDERGGRLHALQQQLWRDGFGPDASDQVCVPRSLGYAPAMRMQVQARAPGVTLNELATGDPLATPVMRCGQALAKLHRTALPAAGEETALHPYRLDDETERLDAYRATILAGRPDQAARVLALTAALTDWAAELPQPPALTVVHRDFYYSQVLFHRARLTLIDFDLLSLGDPAMDAANFTAHLAFLGLDRLADLDALAAEGQQFMASYARHAAVDDAFLRRWAWYQAATFFRLLNVVAPRPGLAHAFDPLLARAELCLERQP